jgi:hypothetical protein
MGTRKDYKNLEDFVKAVASAHCSEVFIFEATANEEGVPVSRTIANEQGIPTEALIVPSKKITNAILLSAEEIKVFGTIKENYFMFYEESSSEMVADDNELAENQAQKEARIGEIYHLFAEKAPEINIVKGRTLPI